MKFFNIRNSLIATLIAIPVVAMAPQAQACPGLTPEQGEEMASTLLQGGFGALDSTTAEKWGGSVISAETMHSPCGGSTNPKIPEHKNDYRTSRFSDTSGAASKMTAAGPSSYSSEASAQFGFRITAPTQGSGD